MKASPINGHCCNVQVIERGLVSVIIPTYNRADLICQTLDSVVSQTYSRYEIIVVDDGSDDNTTEVLASWQERTEDNCLQVFTAQHFGAPAARNLGLRKSRGEYIQYLDSDDLLLPGKLSDQVSYLEKHADAAAVYSFSRHFKGDNRLEQRASLYLDPPERLQFCLRSYCTMCRPEALLWRRRTVVDLGPWDEFLCRWQDWDFLVRFLAAKPVLGCIRRVHSLGRIHGGRITDQDHGERGARDAESMAHALGKAYNLIEPLGKPSLQALSERIWLAAVFMEQRGHGVPLRHTLGLLENLRTRGGLAPIVRLALEKDGSLSKKRSKWLKSYYQISSRIGRYLAMRWPD